MSTVTAFSGTSVNHPDSYSGMNDLIIPGAPYQSLAVYEQYRFEPIALIDEQNEVLELQAYIFVEPNKPLSAANFNENVKSWYQSEQKQHDVKFKILEQKKKQTANKDSVYLVLESKGYGDKLEKDQEYHHHVYLIKNDNHQYSVIRLSRLKQNDKKNSSLWEQWQSFLNSIQINEPFSAGLPTKGQQDNTRRYYAHNLSFDIPLGDHRELDKWIIENSAARKDTWNTEYGNLAVSINLIDDYDFKAKQKNQKYQQEAEALKAGGTEFFKENSGEALNYDYKELNFSGNHTLYGYIEKSDSHSVLLLKSSYKTGRAVKIEISGKNETLEKSYSAIVAWVKNIIVLN